MSIHARETARHSACDYVCLSVFDVFSMFQAWIVKIAPQGEIQIPLEYTVEWPMGKEVDFKESYAT